MSKRDPTIKQRNSRLFKRYEEIGFSLVKVIVPDEKKEELKQLAAKWRHEAKQVVKGGM